MRGPRSPLRTVTIQPYRRNTGELVREAVAPFNTGGEHYAVVRVGKVILKGSVPRRVAVRWWRRAWFPP